MKRYVNFQLILLLLGLSVMSVAAQTAGEIKNKYPAEGGGYVVRPGVIMTAKFNDQICEASINPRPTVGSEARQQGMIEANDGTWLMSWTLVDDVLNEVAQIRGHSSHPPMLTFSGGCSSVRLDVYGNVHVYTSVICLPGGGSGVSEVKLVWGNQN